MKILTRILISLWLLMLSVNVQALSSHDRKQMDVAVNTYLNALQKNDYEKVIAFIHPKYIAKLAEFFKVSPEHQKNELIKDGKYFAEMIKTPSKISIGKSIKIQKSSIGRNYVALKRTSTVTYRGYTTTTIDNVLAIQDNKKWWMIGIFNVTEADLVREAFPDIKEIKLFKKKVIQHSKPSN